MSEEATFDWEITTAVDTSTGRPWVGVSFWWSPPEGPRKLAGAMRWSPQETRSRGFQLQQAAEAAELDAHLVVALRERKMAEEEIADIIGTLRKRRGQQ